MAATSDGGLVQISQRLAGMQFVGYLALGRYLQYFGNWLFDQSLRGRNENNFCIVSIYMHA